MQNLLLLAIGWGAGRDEGFQIEALRKTHGRDFAGHLKLRMPDFSAELSNRS